MKKPINLRWFSCKSICALFLFITLATISFVANADELRDISPPVCIDKLPDNIVLRLDKENLSGYVEFISEEEALKLLEIVKLKNESKVKIEELKQALARVEKENKSREEMDNLKKEIKKAEEDFKNAQSQYDKTTIKIIIEKGYTSSIRFNEINDDIKTTAPVPFSFYGARRKTGMILIPESNDLKLSEDIEAELILKYSQVEIVKQGEKYKLNFDKAKDIVIKLQSELRGKIELKDNVFPQINNPIYFAEKRSPPGKRFKIKIPVGEEGEKRKLYVYFINKQGNAFFFPAMSVGIKEEDDIHYTFKPNVPNVPKSLHGEVTVAALITDNKGELKAYNSSLFQIGDQTAAGFYGLLITVVVIWSITLLIKGNISKWWRAPLDFTVTPLHRYSISLLQILIWTGITIFAYLYVLFLKVECIHLTNQILILLGISGGTALSAKAIGLMRCREIPEEYFKEDSKDLREGRTPKFSDYVTIGGIPNLFKFQILGFTVITGIFVLIEVIKSANFPEIPEELLILMGISGGVYIGNEAATENVWKKIEEKIKNAKEIHKKKLESKEKLKNAEIIINELSGTDKLAKQKEIEKLKEEINVMQTELKELNPEIKKDVKELLDL